MLTSKRVKWRPFELRKSISRWPTNEKWQKKTIALGTGNQAKLGVRRLSSYLPTNPIVSPLNSIQSVRMFDGESVEPVYHRHTESQLVTPVAECREITFDDDSLADIKPLAPDMIEEEKRDSEDHRELLSPLNPVIDNEDKESVKISVNGSCGFTFRRKSSHGSHISSVSST